MGTLGHRSLRYGFYTFTSTSAIEARCPLFISSCILLCSSTIYLCVEAVLEAGEECGNVAEALRIAAARLLKGGGPDGLAFAVSPEPYPEHVGEIADLHPSSFGVILGMQGTASRFSLVRHNNSS